MNRGMQPPLAPTLGALAVTRMLREVGDQPCIEEALPIRPGIQATIEVEVRTCQDQPHLLGPLLQGLAALGQQHPSCGVARSHRDRRSHRAMVVADRAAGVPLLVCVPRDPTALPPGVAPVWVPSPWSPRASRW